MKKATRESEFDFSLVIDGVAELNDDVLDALFNAGCDDATFTIRYGRLFAEFSRSAESMKDAILSAIRDIRKANIGAVVLRVNSCELVTQAEIARRIDRSRQLITQYINGTRGPGGFPAPECHLAEGSPLWAWCAVTAWLAQNDMIRPQAQWDAWIVNTINNSLDAQRQQEQNPSLFREIKNLINTH